MMKVVVPRTAGPAARKTSNEEPRDGILLGCGLRYAGFEACRERGMAVVDGAIAEVVRERSGWMKSGRGDWRRNAVGVARFRRQLEYERALPSRSRSQRARRTFFFLSSFDLRLWGRS